MYRYQRQYIGKLKGIIFDWAGTTVDYGCFAPTMVFIEGFKEFGIDITLAEAREPMGAAKRDHIAAVLNMPRVSKLWEETHGSAPTDDDVQAIYDKFVPKQIEVIAQYADPIAGIPETIEAIRSRDMKIGSCSGYIRSMMDAMIPVSAEKGYKPDFSVASDEVPAGRPAPWMAIQNAQLMNVYPLSAVVKVGDTVTDIEEGLNAGMWTIGIAKTGNLLGMTEDEANQLDAETLDSRLTSIRQTLYQTGAHFVIDSVADILPILDEIEARMR